MEIRGALATLRPVTERSFTKVHAEFQAPELWRAIHAQKAPALEVMKNRIFARKSLRLWQIFPEGSTTAVGYAGYRTFNGRSFLFVIFTSGGFNADVAQDALLPLVHEYFQNTLPSLPEYMHSEPLMIYLPRSALDAMHPFLIDNGFDPHDDYPIIDTSKEMAYGLEPQTYQAYYGGGNELPAEEDA